MLRHFFYLLYNVSGDDMDITITRAQARNYLVNYHRINVNQRIVDGLSIIDIFRRLYAIQYDPLNVVGYNHDLVLQARVPGYKQNDLNKELYDNRTVIDGFDKVQCMYLVDEYPKFKRVRDYRSNMVYEDVLKYGKFSVFDYTNQVMEYLIEHGPSYSKDITMGESFPLYWGKINPANVALDYLLHHGDIVIRDRKKTHKLFDIIERVFHELNQEDPFDTEEAFLMWYVLRRVKSVGMISNKSGEHWNGYLIKSKKMRTPILEKLVKEEYLDVIHVEGVNEVYYVPKGYLEYEDNVVDKVSFIAPLDNMVWDRKMLVDLFDFDYKWEVYVPKSKRVYGYYVLPILYRDQFIGRIEFENYKGDSLQLITMWMEDNVVADHHLKQLIDEAVKRFEEYLKV